MRRLQERRSGSDEGFTLIELSVAMFITLLVVASLTGTFIAGLSGTALAKQRQAATALATESMEQLRALDYGTLSAGMSCDDLLVGDTKIAITGGSCGTSNATATLTAGVSGIVEPVVVKYSGTGVAPITPHYTSNQLENVTYQRWVYVTRTTLTDAAFNLTVIVQWTSNVSNGTKRVVQRSNGYSPSRCLSSATHPYAGACQAAFNGDAGRTKSGITIINADDGTSALPGLNGEKLDLSLSGISSTLSSEQITKLTGVVSTSSAEQTVAGVTSTTGGTSLTAIADNDPSSTDLLVGAPSPIVQSSVTPRTLSGTAGTLSMVPFGGGGGASEAYISSSATSCLDGTAAGAAIPQSANRPCNWSSQTNTGSNAAVNLALTGGGPNFDLATFAPSSVASRATVARIGATGGTACPTTSGAGCLTSQSSRTLGDVRLGMFPTAGVVSLPAGWNGAFVTVSGVAESAYADAGVGRRTTAAGFTRSGGTLRYYDVATGSVATVDLTSLTSDFARDLGTVSATSNQGGFTTVVNVSGRITAGSRNALPTPANADPTACKAEACLYSGTPASTLTGTFVYEVLIDGVQATKFAMTVDLGAVLARSSYKAAFDA